MWSPYVIICEANKVNYVYSKEALILFQYVLVVLRSIL